MPTGKRVARVAGALAVFGLTAGAAFWAGRVTLQSEDAPTGDASSAVEVGVVEGSVGSALPLNVTVRQPLTLSASNGLDGIVTKTSDASTFSTGDVIYAVAGRDVCVVRGDTPFYRDLVLGVQGQDVRQLQEALVSLGHLQGEPDGRFGAQTERALKAWQRARGAEASGFVQLGELVAVRDLPGGLVLGEEIRLGASLTGGEEAVFAPGGVPQFALVVSRDQAAMIPADATVTIRLDDLVWSAVIAGSYVDENGATVFDLAAADGGPPCGAECDHLPPDEEMSLRAEVVVVPLTTGPTIPAAAVRTDEQGATYVASPNGERIPVTVRAAGNGLAVVEGLAVGDTILLLDGGGSADSADGTADQSRDGSG